MSRSTCLGSGSNASNSARSRALISRTAKSYESIKLGIDAHAKWYYVSRQLDGATPHPAHAFTVFMRNLHLKMMVELVERI